MGHFQTWFMRGGRCGLRIFIHFMVCLSLCSNANSNSLETDRQALVAFKAKITNDPFRIMRLWNDSANLCQWHGVTCSIRHQRVTKLSLFSLKLGGSISPQIGNLSFLHDLQLQNNSFTQQIPPEIGRLRRLQMLDLRNNSLGGEIPVNLSHCSELRSLFLSKNKLEGGIPWDLGSLSKLITFGVSVNNLTRPLPPSLGNLTSLEELYVSGNNLGGRIPESFGNLGRLRCLAVGGNQLSGQVPSSLFNLSSLEILDVGYNHLGGPLPSDLFHTLPNIQLLSLDDNHFIGPIPSSLSNASNLQALLISRNKLSGKVPTLETLKDLSEFTIDHNQLGSGFGAKDDLTFLCSLRNATTLSWLLLQHNNFGGTFPQCVTNLSSQLTFMAIYSNHISGRIPQHIDNLIGLESLSIWNNSFTGTIPDTIGNLQNLGELDLALNSLSGVIPSSLGKLSKLASLDLSSNNLEGTIPSSLQNCSSLQLLNLKQNNLTGSIPPQVFTIPSLTVALSVSYNQLSGPLPEEVGKLTNLNLLDVSSNMLSGKIPDSFGECTSMQILGLYENNFHGSIPSSMSSMRGLEVLDVDNNNLSGEIPPFLASLVYLIMLDLSFNDLEGQVPTKGVFLNASAVVVKGNKKLCGGIAALHLPQCSTSPKKKKQKLPVKTKLIIVIVAVLVGVALFFLLLLSIFGLRKKKRQTGKQDAIADLENPTLQCVSYRDLHRTTSGFSQGNLIGEGSYGCVYRGTLGEGGRVVAIKVLDLKRHGASKSFVAECQALRNIRHKNLVKLLTVCSGIDYQGNEFKALVYEFLPNGSLEDWLYPPAESEEEDVMHEQTANRKLGLLKRLGIAIDVASLLEYVHHEFGAPLVHCDIKPSNILLDDGFSGHVGDFGLAKFLSDDGVIPGSIHPSSSSTGVRGTVGYAPLEYGAGSEVSTQGDVYSYGILLLEMFTGKRPTHEMFKEGLNLHLYSKMALPSDVLSILDPTLQDLLEAEEPVLNPKRSTRVVDCLTSVIEIGVACSLESPAQRMDMRAVTSKLHQIRDVLLKGGN